MPLTNDIKSVTIDLLQGKFFDKAKSYYSIGLARYRRMEDKMISAFEKFLENISNTKDQLLYVAIRRYWPRRITPNQLTVARIIISAALFIVLFNFKNTNGLVVLPLFFIGILTDLFDGAVARGLDMKTRTGEIMDPIADRLLIIPVAVYSLITYQKLLLILLILGEVVNGSISVITYGKKIFFGSNIFGKTKMFLQSIVFMAMLIFWPQVPNSFFIFLLWFSLFLLILSIMTKIMQIKFYYASLKNANKNT